MGRPTAGLRALFADHAAYVWNTFRRVGVPPSDLEDLTHDLFVELGRHVDAYDPDRPVRPWLFGFAFLLAWQHRRRAYRHRETEAVDGSAAGEAVDPALLPDETLAVREDQRLVLRALEAIDLDWRAVFVLHTIDGEPMSEIARALGIPVNTAYSRLRVARTEFAAAVKRLRPKRGER